MIEWTKETAENQYRIPHWGQGFFGINDKGHLSVYPTKEVKGRELIYQK